MGNLAVFTVIAVTSFSAAYADGPGPASAPSVVGAPPPPQSFAGAYAGLEFGKVGSTGDETITTGPIFSPDISFTNGDALGAFAGYNAQSGRFVYGGELRYLSFDDFELGGFDGDNVIDVRGRVGFVTGSVMLYGALGWSWWSTSNLSVDGDLDGVNLGVGMEYNVTDRFLLGVDYTLRKVDGNLSADREYDGDLDTISLRAGMRF